jgi:hypothetical protein
MGGTAAHSSGDIFFAFATGNRGLDGVGELPVRMLSDTEITPFYDAVIESTEEAILNAMLASETMTGRDGNTVHALDPELLLEASLSRRRSSGRARIARRSFSVSALTGAQPTYPQREQSGLACRSGFGESFL